MSLKFFSQKNNDLLELTVKNLKSWLEELNHQKVKPLCKEAQKIRSRLEIELKELKIIGEEISRAQYRAGEMEAPFIGVIKKTKDALSVAALHEWDLGSATLTNFEAVSSLKVKADQIFKLLHSTCSSNRKVAHAFLKSHLKKVEGKMKNVAHEVTTLERLIDSYSSKIEDLRLMSDTANELSNLLEKREMSREELNNLEKRLAMMKLEIDETVSKLSSLRQNPSFSEAEKMAADRIKLENEASDIEASTRSILNALSRPLNKYRYLVQGDKQKLQLLNILEYLETFLKQGNSENILSLISDVKRSVEKGELQVKNSTKTIESLHHLADILPSMSKRYLDLQRQIDERKSQTKHEVIVEIELLERRLGELDTSKKSIEAETSEVFRRCPQIDRELKEKAAQLEKEIRQILDVKVKIKPL